MPEYKECTAPGALYDGEWCREYCLDYGTGKCHYDRETRRMLIECPPTETK